MNLPATPAEAVARIAAAVPAHVRAVCERLTAAGHQTVTVGGAVRDALIGRIPGDWDVATSARPEAVMALFKRTVPTGIQHGTVTIVTGHGEASHVEVTTFRGEGAYTDARRPDHVTFGVPLVEDLARRDLRVNAMAFDPATGSLIDPYEGQRDLAEGLLRAVGPTGDVYADAVARFTEDGLRVMRAVRFAAVLEIPLDPETVRGIGPALPSLTRVSRERVSDELRKLLATRQPSLGLRIAHASGIVRSIAPALADGLDASGPDADAPVAAWAERVDRVTLDEASGGGVATRLGALWLDLGGRGPARRLDRALVKRANDQLKALKFSNEEAARAAVIVGTAGPVHVAAWTERDARLLLADVGRGHARAVALVWRAAGALQLADHADAILARGDALATSELAVTGGDLMTALALAPGPGLGKLLAALTARVLDEPALNTRDALIAAARAASA